MAILFLSPSIVLAEAGNITTSISGSSALDRLTGIDGNRPTSPGEVQALFQQVDNEAFNRITQSNDNLARNRVFIGSLGANELVSIDFGDEPQDQGAGVAFVVEQFVAFFVLGTVSEAAEGGLDAPGLANNGVESNATVTNFAQTDPFLATNIRPTNPTSETQFFRIESTIEIEPLDHTSAVIEGFYSAEVFDTGGEPGAELTFDIGHSVRGADTGNETALFIELNHSGTINQGAPSVLDVPESDLRFGPSEPIDRLLTASIFSLSPGDTAELNLIGNFGDADTPLVPIADIRADLITASAFAADFVPVPEPGSLAIASLGFLYCSLLRPRGAALGV